ncbi:hypothetical protein [Paenibacillus turpanensis]|uniref:hypothetical protein n=1 Tax=Paenibacillus turpanensis TaxID=2689078 RepID=UPI00140C9078|nr:hypothetical protein [Paenibacillus turpanensis]
MRQSIKVKQQQDPVSTLLQADSREAQHLASAFREELADELGARMEPVKSAQARMSR